MFARLSVTEGTANREAIVNQLATQVVPAVENHPGFRGLMASHDAANNLLYVLTNWESEADVQSSEALADSARQQAVSSLRAAVKEVTVWEQVDGIVRATPPAGAKLLVTRASMDPATLDANIGFFRDEMLPGITSAPGFCALRHLVQRSAGTSMIGTVWTDQSALEGALKMAGEGLQVGRARGIDFEAPAVRDVVYVSVPPTVM